MEKTNIDTAVLNAEENSRAAQLKLIAGELLSLNQPTELREAAINLYSLFSKAAGRKADAGSRADSPDVFLPSGKAISPAQAAMCILDFARTAKFLRGINDALVELQKRFPGERLEILYAGCGPFATLAVPLAARFDSSEIQFTLLDVHENSLDSARRIFQFFGLANYAGNFIRSDAATYVHPIAPHLIITETMQRALEKEPQIAVTLNLAPQLRQNGIFIPERICVDAYLYDSQKEFLILPAEADESAFDDLEAKRVRIHLGRIFEITAGKSFEIPETNRLPSVTVDVPKDADKNLKLMLSTKVVIFEAVRLEEYESAITYPLPLNDVDWTQCGNQLEFTYSLGGKPRFEYQRADCK